jgi:hypothetical protein
MKPLTPLDVVLHMLRDSSWPGNQGARSNLSSSFDAVKLVEGESKILQSANSD